MLASNFSGMLYLVGLGLGDARDITVRGLEIVKRCDKVYLEAYTSILTCGKEELEKLYGREVILADRDFVSTDCLVHYIKLTLIWLIS